METVMNIKRLDHFVLTVRDLDATCDFYTRVMGMAVHSFGPNNERRALHYGDEKINLHRAGHEIEPKAAIATPDSADLCFITEAPIEEVIAHLKSKDVSILMGPVPRTGALGPIISVYFRDPDGNLLEVSNYGKQ
jgi:catechol 2,3-dioxygenase-like lactoylglutathione lyase family enzyme